MVCPEPPLNVNASIKSRLKQSSSLFPPSLFLLDLCRIHKSRPKNARSLSPMTNKGLTINKGLIILNIKIEQYTSTYIWERLGLQNQEIIRLFEKQDFKFDVRVIYVPRMLDRHVKGNKCCLCIARAYGDIRAIQ